MSLGVLQPGDWDLWAFGQTTTLVSDVQFNLQPQPAGFTGALAAIFGTPSGTAQDYTIALAPTARALTSVPTLLAFYYAFNQFGAGPSAGSMNLFPFARRRR